MGHFKHRELAARLCQGFKALEDLRNNLAHSEDIISNDWEALVMLSADLDRVISGTEQVQNAIMGNPLGFREDESDG